MNSPNFSVKQDQWYRASFDIKTGSNEQLVSVITRRGGGGSNGYVPLMNALFDFTGSTTWQRYSFLFKATKTVNVLDLITLDVGARIDFHLDTPGQKLSVANLELVPVSPVDATLRSHVLINPTSAPLDKFCPDGSNTLACGEYVRFSDNIGVRWPHTLPANGSEIIYSRHT